MAVSSESPHGKKITTIIFWYKNYSNHKIKTKTGHSWEIITILFLSFVNTKFFSS